MLAKFDAKVEKGRAAKLPVKNLRIINYKLYWVMSSKLREKTWMMSKLMREVPFCKGMTITGCLSLRQAQYRLKLRMTTFLQRND